MARGRLALLSVLLVLGIEAQLSSFFGGSEPVDGELYIEADGEDADDASIDNVVEQLTSQLKSHLRTQMRSMKMGGGAMGSKLASSKLTSLTELHIAVANNQYEVVERLLAEGANPNVKSPAQMTPLHSAADGGYKDIVNLLLAYNASMEIAGPHGVTPLHLAAHRGRMSTVELLLREGCQINVLTDPEFSYSPLYMAADMGHTRVVEVLLAANASTELRSTHGSTALHAAVVGAHDSVVRALISGGADVNAADNDGLRPLFFALGSSSERKDEMVRLLEEVRQAAPRAT